MKNISIGIMQIFTGIDIRFIFFKALLEDIQATVHGFAFSLLIPAIATHGKLAPKPPAKQLWKGFRDRTRVICRV